MLGQIKRVYGGKEQNKVVGPKIYIKSEVHSPKATTV